MKNINLLVKYHALKKKHICIKLLNLDYNMFCMQIVRAIHKHGSFTDVYWYVTIFMRIFIEIHFQRYYMLFKLR